VRFGRRPDLGQAPALSSKRGLWWPPNKLCGLYLAPYLSGQTGEAADVRPEGKGAIPAILLDPMMPDTQITSGELSDLPRQ
jgi:hypothetical protein